MRRQQVLESEMGGVRDREIALAWHWMRSGRAREADGLPLKHGCGWSDLRFGLTSDIE